MFFINGIGFWWTVLILFQTNTITNNYITYIIILFIFNLIELILTIFSAVKTRKGIHVKWWFYGVITDAICKK